MPQKRSAKYQAIPVHMRYLEYLDIAHKAYRNGGWYVIEPGELSIEDCWSSSGYVFYVEALDMAVTVFGDHGGAMDELRELLPEDV